MGGICEQILLPGFLPYVCLPTVCWPWKPKTDFLCLSVPSKLIALCWRCYLTRHSKPPFFIYMYMKNSLYIILYIYKYIYSLPDLMCKFGHLTKFGLDLRIVRNDNSDLIWLTFLIIYYQINKQGHTHDQGSMEVWRDSGPQGILRCSWMWILKSVVTAAHRRRHHQVRRLCMGSLSFYIILNREGKREGNVCFHGFIFYHKQNILLQPFLYNLVPWWEGGMEVLMPYRVMKPAPNFSSVSLAVANPNGLMSFLHLFVPLLLTHICKSHVHIRYSNNSRNSKLSDAYFPLKIFFFKSFFFF